MNHNLLPPLILIEGGLVVKDVPKIQCVNPTKDDHCISFSNSDLQIPLQLNGVFSYFDSRIPLPSELYSKDKLFLTPDASEWNPNCQSFEENEGAMTNHVGDITDNARHLNRCMEPLHDPNEIFELASVKTSQ